MEDGELCDSGFFPRALVHIDENCYCSKCQRTKKALETVPPSLAAVPSDTMTAIVADGSATARKKAETEKEHAEAMVTAAEAAATGAEAAASEADAMYKKVADLECLVVQLEAQLKASKGAAPATTASNVSKGAGSDIRVQGLKRISLVLRQHATETVRGMVVTFRAAMLISTRDMAEEEALMVIEEDAAKERAMRIFETIVQRWTLGFTRGLLRNWQKQHMASVLDEAEEVMTSTGHSQNDANKGRAIKTLGYMVKRWSQQKAQQVLASWRLSAAEDLNDLAMMELDIEMNEQLEAKKRELENNAKTAMVRAEKAKAIHFRNSQQGNLRNINLIMRIWQELSIQRIVWTWRYNMSLGKIKSVCDQLEDVYSQDSKKKRDRSLKRMQDVMKKWTNVFVRSAISTWYRGLVAENEDFAAIVIKEEALKSRAMHIFAAILERWSSNFTHGLLRNWDKQHMLEVIEKAKVAMTSTVALAKNSQQGQSQQRAMKSLAQIMKRWLEQGARSCVTKMRLNSSEDLSDEIVTTAMMELDQKLNQKLMDKQKEVEMNEDAALRDLRADHVSLKKTTAIKTWSSYLRQWGWQKIRNNITAWYCITQESANDLVVQCMEEDASRNHSITLLRSIMKRWVLNAARLSVRQWWLQSQGDVVQVRTNNLMRALKPLKLAELVQKANDRGVDNKTQQQVMDCENPREALIALIIEHDTKVELGGPSIEPPIKNENRSTSRQTTNGQDDSKTSSLRKKSLPVTEVAAVNSQQLEVITAYFNMYDLNHNGTIDGGDELKQLTSAVLFKLKIRVRSKELAAILEESQNASFTISTYSAWFCQTFLNNDNS